MGMVDPQKIAELYMPAKEKDNGTLRKRISYWFGETMLWCLGTNGHNAYTKEQIEHTPPYKVRRIGNRVITVLTASATIGVAIGTYAYLQSDEHNGLVKTCAISANKMDYHPEWATNWDAAVAQVPGTSESLICYQAVKSQLQAQYGKPSYGTTYQIPLDAHEVKVSVTTVPEVQVTTIPGTTPQN